VELPEFLDFQEFRVRREFQDFPELPVSPELQEFLALVELPV
jgi:hypothetical protein